MKRALPLRVLVTIAFASVSLLSPISAQSQVNANAASCYSSLLSGPPPTLSAYVESINNGAVAVNGLDSASPTAPFQWNWGDGSTSSGFFPQQHIYSNTSQNYIVTITANEDNGTIQQFSFTVFLVAPALQAQPRPADVSFQIPTQAPALTTHTANAPPADLSPFSDSSFPIYTRSDLAYILAAIASIDYGFANRNSFLLNGIFSIDMVQLTDLAGGVSFWFTTPMAVGYSSAVLTPSPQWFVLFNEIGKDTTLNTPQSLPFGGNTDGNASEIYSETMGDIFSYASGCELVNSAGFYGLGPDVAQDIRSSLLSGAAALQNSFRSYVAAGAPFDSWNPYNGNPDPTLGAISTLAWKFIEHAEFEGIGYARPATRLMTLLQLFDPSMLAAYAPQANTQQAATFRSTLLVAALSYAFSEDLRSEFEALNFPIDDSTFEQLYEMASLGQPPPLSPFFSGQVDEGDGTLYLVFPNGTIFGYYAVLGGNWFRHADLGQEYVVPASGPSNGVYLWDLESGHWFYTAPSAFPCLYDFSLNVWLYYFPNESRAGHYATNPRYFLNLATGAIFTM